MKIVVAIDHIKEGSYLTMTIENVDYTRTDSRGMYEVVSKGNVIAEFPTARLLYVLSEYPKPTEEEEKKRIVERALMEHQGVLEAAGVALTTLEEAQTDAQLKDVE